AARRQTVAGSSGIHDDRRQVELREGGPLAGPRARTVPNAERGAEVVVELGHTLVEYLRDGVCERRPLEAQRLARALGVLEYADMHIPLGLLRIVGSAGHLRLGAAVRELHARERRHAELPPDIEWPVQRPQIRQRPAWRQRRAAAAPAGGCVGAA